MGNWSPNNRAILILFVAAKIKEILILGKDYPWPRPERCPRCKSGGVWGHGFVLGYFDGFNQGIYLRRYRCPLCCCVLRTRPESHFSRLQCSIVTIRSNLSHRLRYGRWPPGISRSRQGHWLRSLKRKIFIYLGLGWVRGLLEGFDYMLPRGINPVSRSM